MLSTVALSTLLLPGLALAAPALVSRQAAGSYIHPNGDTSRCLTVPPSPNAVADGTSVSSGRCGSAPLQTWDIVPGSTAVRLSGTNFCFDAGSDPRNNVPLKLWTCYDGLPAQTWYLTNDGRIAVEGDDQCLDLGTNGLQTYQCTTGNTNQFFTISSSGNPSPEPSSTSSSAAGPGPTGTYTGIHPKGVEGQCISIAQPFANGNEATVYPCNGGDGQNFDIKRGSGKIRLRANPSFCLDAGVDPRNNIALKIWECLDSVPQQQFYFTDDGRVAVEGDDQCADLRDGSLAPGNTVQTYQCTTGNDNQFFTARV